MLTGPILKANGFESVKFLGQGSFGVVTEVVNSKTKAKYAAKTVVSDSASADEFYLWTRLRHPNILPVEKIYSVPSLSQHVFLTPLQPYSLDKLVESKMFRALPDPLTYVRSWVRDVLSGLVYMQSKDLCHLDLKSDNILVDRYNRAVICDLGFIHSASIPAEKWGLPLRYRPPEACWTNLDAVVDPSLFDTWTVGMLTLEILTKHALERTIPNSIASWSTGCYPAIYELLEEPTFSRTIQKNLYGCTLSEDEIFTVRNFILMCLNVEPRNRPSAEYASNHKFVGGSYLSLQIDPRWQTKYPESCIKRTISVFNQSLSDTRFSQDNRLHQYSGSTPWIVLDHNGFVMEQIFPDGLEDDPSEISTQNSVSANSNIASIQPLAADTSIAKHSSIQSGFCASKASIDRGNHPPVTPATTQAPEPRHSADPSDESKPIGVSSRKKKRSRLARIAQKAVESFTRARARIVKVFRRR